MKNLLMNCYYDGMTLQQAIEFVTRVEEAPTTRQIENAKKSVRECTNKEWI